MGKRITALHTLCCAIRVLTFRFELFLNEKYHAKLYVPA